MTRTAVAVLQTPWDCRWSLPRVPLTGLMDCCEPETIWVCVRTGVRRPVDADQCETCPHWEADEGRTN
jgi:hypothetical protein